MADEVSFLLNSELVVVLAGEAREILDQCSHQRNLGAEELSRAIRAAMGAPSTVHEIRMTEPMRQELSLSLDAMAVDPGLSNGLQELRAVARRPIRAF